MSPLTGRPTLAAHLQRRGTASQLTGASSVTARLTQRTQNDVTIQTGSTISDALILPFVIGS